MKILAIRGQNLASLEGTFEVDFTQEPLLSAGIFAITGPTGAGKSTLLDAMCLALFAKTPRLLQAREPGVSLKDGENGSIAQGDVRGILRKGTAEGYAEVEFVGQDEMRYRATWSVRRARNYAAGNLQADSVQLINLSNGDKFGDRKNQTLQEIENLVGLNFEQFTRSVLLAQGDFTAFLKAEKKEKAALLEKLTGTDIYSRISIQIYEREREEYRELEVTKNELKGIALLSGEDLAATQEQKARVEKEILALAEQREKLNGAVQWHLVCNELLESFQKAEAENERIKAEHVLAADRRGKLALIDRVQDARDPYDKKRNCERIKDEREQKKAETWKELKKQQQSVEQAGLKLTEKEKALSEAKMAYEDAKPSIMEAGRLDNQLEQKTKELAFAAEEEAAAREATTMGRLALEEKSQKVIEVREQINKLSAWKEKNSRGEAIARNIEVITARLNDCGQLLAQRLKISESIQSLDLQVALNDESVKKEILTKFEKKLEEEKAMLEIQLDQKALINIENIRKRKESSSVRMEALSTAKATWKDFQEALNRREELSRELVEFSDDLSQQKSILEEKKQALSDAAIKKELTDKQYASALLKTQKDVKTLRSHLTEGGACPVCGSLEHPYAQEPDVLQHVLQGLQLEAADCRQVHEGLLSTCATLSQVVKNLEHSIRKTEAEKNIAILKEEELQQQWERTFLFRESQSVLQKDRSSWFGKEQEILRTTINQLNEEEGIYHQLSSATEKQQQKVRALSEDIQQHREALQQLKADNALLKQKLQQAQQRIEELEKELHENKKALDVYASNEGWFTKWQEDPGTYLQSVQKFASSWEENTAALTQHVSQQGIIDTQLAGLRSQLEELQQREQSAVAKLNRLGNEEQELKDARNKLFEGKTVVAVENAFAARLQQLQQQYEDCQREEAGVSKALSSSEGILRQIQKDVEVNDEQLGTCIQQLENWLQNFNNSSETRINEVILKDLLSFRAEWISNERHELERLNNEFLRATNSLEHQKEQLQQHQQKNKPAMELQELQVSLQEMKKLLELKAEEDTEFGYKLRTDKDNKQKTEALRDKESKKAEIHEQWKKLADLIGSANGDKFRQVAQEYTIEILLSYANIHLHELKPRYSMARIPDTLALQVIDQDMGGEIRSVHSLSGGESFLVSLALALGLASLSSNRMKVESLFIDEGFGSLDPETLRIAMDALELLHNQGRKVGVISHVQEMTERIQTQVSVSRVSGGRSKVEVSGMNQLV